MATAYGKRPSEFVGETDPRAAWIIDRCAFLAGSFSDPKEKNDLVLEG
jgi:hypothetical protein